MGLYQDSGRVLRLGSTTVKRQQNCETWGMGGAASLGLRKSAADISVKSECEVRFSLPLIGEVRVY